MENHMQSQSLSNDSLLSQDRERLQIESDYLRRLFSQPTDRATDNLQALQSHEPGAQAVELALIDRLVNFAHETEGDPGRVLAFLERIELADIFPPEDQSAEAVRPRRFADLVALRRASQTGG